jgi:hypothetical protein
LEKHSQPADVFGFGILAPNLELGGDRTAIRGHDPQRIKFLGRQLSFTKRNTRRHDPAGGRLRPRRDVDSQWHAAQTAPRGLAGKVLRIQRERFACQPTQRRQEAVHAMHRVHKLLAIAPAVIEEPVIGIVVAYQFAAITHLARLLGIHFGRPVGDGLVSLPMKNDRRRQAGSHMVVR